MPTLAGGMLLATFRSRWRPAGLHPSGRHLQLEPVASGLQAPVYITHAGDDSGRLFVVESPGRIRIIQNGLGRLSLSWISETGYARLPLVPTASGEQGLLGLAFPPGFADKGYFYAYYTRMDGDNILARFCLSADPNRAEAKSEQVLLLLEHSAYPEHNAGQWILVRTATCTWARATAAERGTRWTEAQNRNSLLGKILRIDVEGGANSRGGNRSWQHVDDDGDLSSCGPGIAFSDRSSSYTIPADNPFAQRRTAILKCGRWGCVIHGGSPLIARQGTCTSATLVKTAARKSISRRQTSPAGRTTAGISWKAASAIPACRTASQRRSRR